MSKLGRYSADRKKIEQLTTSAKNITVADCGTIFMLKGALGADVTHTVPHPADAGNGWWCKFVVQATGSSDSVLDLGGDDCLIKIRAAGNEDGTSLVDDLLVVNVNPGAGDGTVSGGHLADQDADFITIKGETLAGSQVELVTDSNKWYLSGMILTGSGGGITVDS